MVQATQGTAAKRSNGDQPPVMTTPKESEKKGDEPIKAGAPRPESTPKSDDAAKKAVPSKKRRKVNHACIYCRRSHMTCDLERPCTRCIKRNIGHLCHDEPREPVKRQKTDTPSVMEDENSAPTRDSENSLGRAASQDAGLALGPPPPPLPRGLPQPASVSAPHAQSIPGNNTSSLNYNDWIFGAPSNFQDMHALNPSFMFNASEASNEYSIFNDLNILMDDGALYSSDEMNQLFSDPSLTNTPGVLSQSNAIFQGNQPSNQLLPPSQAAAANTITRPPSSFPLDKAREAYYMTAADPAGTDTPEERMNKLLKAKFDAGMLKPFNYIKGYARLYQYMEQRFQPISRQKILRCMDRFRPKFRERVQTLTDIELVRVEMWFERCLMEYDRVFASMAIPACCWRRTGEIFRGNKEMAELVHVPMDNLRDGTLSLHQIVEEKSLVNYWEKFGAIAFDASQKAILTMCSLKNPNPDSKDPEIRCCFSFTIRRDAHNIPSLIVGNFLPIIRDDS